MADPTKQEMRACPECRKPDGSPRLTNLAGRCPRCHGTGQVEALLTSEQTAVPDWDAIQAEEIRTLEFLGERIGYGRCVQIIQRQWSQKLQREHSMSRHTADLAVGEICVWCNTDRRSGKVVKDAS